MPEQPIAEIAGIAHQSGAAFHVDGVQALGKVPVDVAQLGVDLYSMSGHKLYAPKGVGALYIRKGSRLAPIAYGGHHERDRRPGTENVPGIAAFGAACSSGALSPSHVLKAIGLSDDRARASMRFSLGRGNTVEQVDSLVEAIGASVAHLRRISVHA